MGKREEAELLKAASANEVHKLGVRNTTTPLAGSSLTLTVQMILTGRSKGLLGLKKKKHDNEEVRHL